MEKIKPIIFGDEINFEYPNEIEMLHYRITYVPNNDAGSTAIESPDAFSKALSYIEANMEKFSWSNSFCTDGFVFQLVHSCNQALYTIFNCGFLQYTMHYLGDFNPTVAAMGDMLLFKDTSYILADIVRSAGSNKDLVDKIIIVLLNGAGQRYSNMIHWLISSNSLDVLAFVKDTMTSENIIDAEDVGNIASEQYIALAFNLCNELADNDISEFAEVLRVIVGRFVAILENLRR